MALDALHAIHASGYGVGVGGRWGGLVDDVTHPRAQPPQAIHASSPRAGFGSPRVEHGGGLSDQGGG